MTQLNIPGVRSFEYTRIVGLEHIRFGNPVIIDDFVFIYATNIITIGNYIHIAVFTSIAGGGTFEMANFSGLAIGIRIVTGSDDFKGSGFGNPTVPRAFRNVHMGTNSVVLPEVEIGEGVAVAARSVVTRDLAPWGVYAGNRRIGERDREGILANYSVFLAAHGASPPPQATNSNE